ncbi:LAME_0C03906g1_1 [Lachancea meyersii CBS 8951]|uniref:LAME_0C03906g1_1 n=1 Tax=Lachancea meyersii CBS 8951 TaxID=1266667 RepID=A0A1G4J0J6_9SACH|nr:LAME_0C03906g1_1 [Lachancea meyersii CBS 8951]
MSSGGANGRFPAGPSGNYESNGYRSREKRVNRNFRGNRYQEESESRYEGRASRGRYGNGFRGARRGTGSRFQQDYRRGNGNGNGRYESRWNDDDVDWEQVVPLNERQRMRPSLWDKPLKGFENVPAERAKLSGLFPLPGQPQELDRSKLDGIVSSGVLTRRTRILFEDPTRANLSKTKYNQILILTAVGSTKPELNEITKFVDSFVKLIDDTQDLKSHAILSDNRLKLHFSSEEITTMVLSCQKYIEAQTKCKFIWQRPGECIRKYKPQDAICGGEVIALLGLEKSDQEALMEDLRKNGVEVNWLKLIVLEKTQEFTGAALLEPISWNNNIRHYRWIRPNDSKLHQDFEEVTFQQLPHLVTRRDHEASRVIVLLNCVDGKDLKNEDFVRELHDCMAQSEIMTSFGEIESVKIPKPGADYRNSFETIEESIGKIFVKFKEVESARSAMQKLPGRQFNDRTVLCAYFSERDYNMGIL